ncbi:hypothetical protein [Nitratireductor indicus]|nr:hypothetical protein [Nitratireductor indicus]MDS1135361.1 hypothetical protein [Nitratireductor indicus]SFQ17140.1 hypothetical protein SAMN05216176_101683 [Nitratireductor indicus]
MDDIIERSCWGVAVKAVICLAAIIFMAWLFVGAEAASVVASAG